MEQLISLLAAGALASIAAWAFFLYVIEPVLTPAIQRLVASQNEEVASTATVSILTVGPQPTVTASLVAVPLAVMLVGAPPAQARDAGSPATIELRAIP